jgi:hypothetical protein
MAQRFELDTQMALSVTPGSLVASTAANAMAYIAPNVGNNHLWYYKDSVTANVPLNLGTNLSFNTATNTLDAAAGSGGYGQVQEEGSNITVRTTLNFVGAGFTAADDAGNSRTNVSLDATLNALAAYNTNGILTQTAADTFVGRTLTAPAAGFSITNPDGVSGNPTFVLANDLAALEGLGATGFATRTAADTWAQRSMTGTAARITITNGDGVAGAPTFDIAATYVGQSSITTLGTIGTGVWNGTAIGPTFGGTGQTTYATGDTLYASAPNTLSKRTIGSAGNFYRVSGGVPVWTTAASTDLSDTANIALLNGNQTFTGNNTFSNNITMNGTPSAGTDVVTVAYVSNIVANGLKYHSVQAATTATQVITARTATTLTVGGTTYTVDGRTMANGEYVLIKDNTSGVGGAGSADNGAFLISGIGSSVLLTRVAYMDAAGEVDGHTFVIEDGSTNGGSIWLTVSEVTTLGTDAVVFTKIQTTGTVTSVSATAPSAGFTISGGPITTAGTFTFTLANDLAAVEGLATNGIAVRTATDTWATRTLTGTAARITITNGDGIAGAPTFDIAATYVGQSSITTLGTIGTGVWNGTAITGAFGGTGQTTTTIGDLLVGAAGNTWNKLAIGGNGTYLTSNGTTASWAALSVPVDECYITGQTGTTFDLDANTGAVTDVDGANKVFTVPADLKKVQVYRNGQLLYRSGTVTRDYTINTSTHVITFVTALVTGSSIYICKFA